MGILVVTIVLCMLVFEGTLRVINPHLLDAYKVDGSVL
jgi:hypothetical protein